MQRLDVSNNKLSSISSEIGNLAKLRYLHLSYNQITLIPSEIGNLASLQKLKITDNKLTTIPPEIGKLTKIVFREPIDDAKRDWKLGQFAVFKQQSIDVDSHQRLEIWLNLETLYLDNNQLTTMVPRLET